MKPVIRRCVKAKMATVEPIFAHNTLQQYDNFHNMLSTTKPDLDHAVIHRVLWVWIWAAALTVDTREVLCKDECDTASRAYRKVSSTWL